MEIKNTVHGLWIEGALSPLELMTVHSFLHHGYQFHLWTYHPDNKNLPKGVVLKDAREIVPESEVFSYTQKNQFGHGKGSYAGFSDIFRYRLLYLYGGWWTDMDITCLKRLPDNSEYFFRANKNTAVGNLIFCIPKSPIMLWCYQKATKAIGADNTNWTLPIEILNEGIQLFGLLSHVQSVSNHDSWLEVSQLINNKTIPDKYICIHWMNEEFRRLDISKKEFPENSNLFKLAQRYQVQINPVKSGYNQLRFYIKTSRLYYILINLKYLPAYLFQK